MKYMYGSMQTLTQKQTSIKTGLPDERMRLNLTKHRLLIGDAREAKPEQIGKVNLVITSPPYWQIKDYGSLKQIGRDESLNEYLNSLKKVWNLCYNVLQPGCRLVINIGDQYLRASKGTPYQIIPLHTKIVNSILNDSQMKFIYLGSIIWKKISTTKTSGGASVMGSYPFPRSVYPCFENEFIAIFRKEGKTPPPNNESKQYSEMSISEWREFTHGVWEFPGEKLDENPAAFPEILPVRLIRMFSFKGEVVFDPFVGSGTTMRAAASWGRNSVGIEIGFNTRSGLPYEKAIREKVLSAPKTDQSGPISFVIEKIL